MGLTVFVPNESGAGEPRVAASPDTVKRMATLRLDVIVETGAGKPSRIPDEEFSKVGASGLFLIFSISAAWIFIAVSKAGM